MGLFDLFSRATPGLAHVSFDTRSYKNGPKSEAKRVWFTPDNDGVGLYYFAVEPDLPEVDTIAQLGAFYGAQAESAGAIPVEFDLLRGTPTLLSMITKFAQEPTGMTYVGALTLPFRDFSYVVKVQCAERGITGMRETALFAAGITEDFDNEGHDTAFPNHPLSRARRVLAHVRKTLVVDPKIAASKKFELP